MPMPTTLRTRGLPRRFCCSFVCQGPGKLLLLIALLALAAGIGAQRQARAQLAAPTPSELLYVDVWHFASDGSSDVAIDPITARDLLTGADQWYMKRRFRVPALAGMQAQVQIGEQIAITTASTFGGNQRVVRQRQFHDVGTLVRIMAQPDETGALVDFDYESSTPGERRSNQPARASDPAADPDAANVAESDDNDSPPGIRKMMLKTTVRAQWDEPLLIEASEGGDRARQEVLIVRISRAGSSAEAARVQGRGDQGRGEVIVPVPVSPQANDASAADPAAAENQVDEGSTEQGDAIARQARMFAEGLVRRFDTSGDGVLDAAELAEIKGLSGEMLRSSDANEDNQVTVEEVSQRLLRRRATRQQR